MFFGSKKVYPECWLDVILKQVLQKSICQIFKHLFVTANSLWNCRRVTEREILDQITNLEKNNEQIKKFCTSKKGYHIPRRDKMSKTD